MYMYIYIYIYTYTHTHVYMYTYTHICIDSYTYKVPMTLSSDEARRFVAEDLGLAMPAPADY